MDNADTILQQRAVHVKFYYYMRDFYRCSLDENISY